jgi:1-acyl-sn-glycerol-3-phosphate acyltransferase
MEYPIARYLVSAMIKPFKRKVTGLENIPKDKTFILAINHSSYMDHFLILTTFVRALDKKVHFLAKKEHFDNAMTSSWHNWAGAVPIDRKAGGKKALRWAIAALKKGKIIAVYPEGTRTLNGKLQEGKTGIARLALAAKVPVLPIGIIGTFEILPKGKKIPCFKRAEMHIGKLMYFDKYYKKQDNYKTLRLITTKIMKEIAKLSKQKYNY